jgi:ABC-type transporter Mla subunit MlaD
MDPERPQIRELLPEEIWERLFTALRSLDAAQDRIDALTAQVEALTAALRETRGEEVG